MKPIISIVVSTVFLGVCAPHACAELKIGGLSCSFPDHWVGIRQNNGTSSDQDDDSYIVMPPISVLAKGKLRISFGSKPSGEEKTLAAIMKSFESTIAHVTESNGTLLGRPKVGGGVVTKEDLGTPTCKIVVHNGVKLVKIRYTFARVTKSKVDGDTVDLVEFQEAYGLYHVDGKTRKYLSINGKRAPFEQIEEEIPKIEASFRIQKAERDGAGQSATRPESDPGAGDKTQPEQEGRSR